QGNTGHCFAHTSADLIAAATGRRVSPLDLATSYVLADPEKVKTSRDSAVQNYLQEKPAFLTQWRKDRGEEPKNFTKEKILTDEGIYWTGGEEMQTIFLANVFGLCDQSKLPDGEANYDSYLKQINAYHQNRLQRQSYSPEERSEPIGEVKEPEARIAAHSFQNWVYQKCGRHWLPRHALLPEVFQFAKDLKAFEKLNSLHALDSVDVNGKIFEKIDELLDHGQIVSIGYSANDIMKISKDFPSGDHASVIAARKTEKGKCVYFVRNSFGDSSDDYLTHFKKSYEAGGVWVKAKDLKSIYSAVWIR
ncbi:MAG: hypothetical protein ACXVBE_13410, partial [Bdellovibrionota bacterium]